jgi:hypothetical protein
VIFAVNAAVRGNVPTVSPEGPGKPDWLPKAYVTSKDSPVTHQNKLPAVDNASPGSYITACRS